MWNKCFSASRRIAFPGRVQPVLLLFAVTAALVYTAQAATTSSVTTLALSSPTVASPAPVTLTATVMAGGAPVTTGSVTFCDVSVATVCEGEAIIGKAQLVALAAAATATLRINPAIGFHKYEAVFNGTTAAATSLPSNTETLTVTGQYPTTTTIGVPTGNQYDGYELTATVVGVGVAGLYPPPLSGTVAFDDTTNNNYVLGTATLGTPSLGQFAQSFPAATVPTGNLPAIAGVGDFNEDGIPDLAVENAGDNTISILLGDGKGGFTLFPQPAPIIAGTPPCENINDQDNCAIVVGDFNDDGHADLAVTSDHDGTVIVLEGNGKGSFAPFGSPIQVGNLPVALKIGDFNNDGNQDLAVANALDDSVSILLGNGQGAFTPATGSPVPTGNFPFFMTLADFNNDGNLDLAVVNGNDSSVSLLQGNGDGTFTPFADSPLFLPNNPGLVAIVAAKFGSDTNVDLAVANYDNGVYILSGDGKGTFTPSPEIAVGPNPIAMTALDYDGDGYTDLAVVNYNYSLDPNPPVGTVQLLKGSSNGSFSLGPQIPVGQLPNDVVTADFNGDGTPDLAIPDSDDTYTTILLNTVTQTETASASTHFTINGTGSHTVEALYSGNSFFAPSTATINLQGGTVASTLTLSTPAPAQQLFGLPVTFTAQVLTGAVPPPPQGPTGTVSFFNGGALLGTAPVNAAGQAVYTTSSLADGTQTITASYSGDVSYLASTATALTVTISDLQIARTGTGDTPVVPGTAVTYTLQVAPQVISTFLYQVTFTTTGLPIGANVAFSPATLPAGGSAATVTMTVTTAKNALNEPPPGPFDRLPLAFGLLLPLCGALRMRKRMLGVMLLAVLSLGAVVGLNGCSGAGLFAGKKVNYSITVIANEGNASGTLQRSTQVPLAIQ